MQIVLLAGGLGTRLRPITQMTPKCMAPLGGKPFLFYLLRLLKMGGAEEIILCTGYLGEQVEACFADGRDMGLTLRYSRETGSLLGTGGALKLAEPLLAEHFLVINGDTYLDIDYRAIYTEFVNSRALVLIVAAPCRQNVCGDLALHDKLVTRYDKTHPAGLGYVNAGVMAFSRSTLVDLEPHCPISLEADVLPRLISRREVAASITSQPFYDIGTFTGLGIFENVLQEVSA